MSVLENKSLCNQSGTLRFVVMGGALALISMSGPIVQQARGQTALLPRSIRVDSIKNLLSTVPLDTGRVSKLKLAVTLADGGGLIGLGIEGQTDLGSALLERGDATNADAAYAEAWLRAQRAGVTTDDAWILIRRGLIRRLRLQPDSAFFFFASALALLHSRMSMFGENVDHWGARYLAAYVSWPLVQEADARLYPMMSIDFDDTIGAPNTWDKFAHDRKWADSTPETRRSRWNPSEAYLDAARHIVGLYRIDGKPERAMRISKAVDELSLLYANEAQSLSLKTILPDEPFVCAGKAAPKFCELPSNDPYSNLLRSIAIQKWLGGIPNEESSLRQLALNLRAIGRADSAVVVEETVQMLAESARSGHWHGNDSSQSGAKSRVVQKENTKSSAITVKVLAVADELERSNGPASASRMLRDTLKTLSSASPISTSFDPIQNATLRAAILEALADISWRQTDVSSRVHARSLYDSSSAVYLNLLAANAADPNRVAIADRAAALHEKWALAWLTDESLPPSFRAIRALGAFERGRSQTFYLARGTVDNGDTAGLLSPYDPYNPYVPIGNRIGEALRMPEGVFTPPTLILSYMVTADTLVRWIYNTSADDPNYRAETFAIGRKSLASLTSIVRDHLASEARDSAVGAHADSLDNAARLRLSQLLLPPDLSRLDSSVEIVIIPHGTLDGFPMGVLTPPGDSVPLGLSHAIRYAPSLGVLQQLDAVGSDSAGLPPLSEKLARDRAREIPFSTSAEILQRFSRSDRQALANRRRAWLSRSVVVGAPNMPVVSDWGDTLHLERLPLMDSEGDTIAALLGSRFRLKGRAATEANVRSRFTEATILHFSTHAESFDDNSLARRSWIALAPDSVDDGFLTAEELYSDTRYRLSSELVVLSACESGGGAMSEAESTIGLPRSLVARGARTVISSLWVVDAAATRLLMIYFYRHWLSDPTEPTKAEALRLAQHDLMRNGRFETAGNWVAFQVIGAR